MEVDYRGKEFYAQLNIMHSSQQRPHPSPLIALPTLIAPRADLHPLRVLRCQ